MTKQQNSRYEIQKITDHLGQTMRYNVRDKSTEESQGYSEKVADFKTKKEATEFIKNSLMVIFNRQRNED